MTYSPQEESETQPAAGRAVPTGRVYLAGAGPGDPELLTVKALRLVRTAPAVVYDALISPEIKALFAPGALRFDVGKRSGRRDSMEQEQISRLLVRLAREGHEVLRLKGGDPFVFGRGGEEALALAAAGISFEVVPGISAAQGAGAALGIPLTHRGLSGSCTFLNGHGPTLDRIDWPALVALGGTWIFYMGKASLGAIADNLLRHGADPALGLAVVESATLPAQAHALMRLGDAPFWRPEVLGDGPALVMVGPSVELALDLATLLPAPGAGERHERPVSGFSQAGR